MTKHKRTIITTLAGETVVCWISDPSWEMVQDVTADHFGAHADSVDLVEPNEDEYEAGYPGDRILVRGEHVADLRTEWR